MSRGGEKRTCELGHARNSGSTAGGQDVADLDLLDEVLADARALDDALEHGLEHVLRARVLQAALLGARDGRAHGGDDDDIVGVLGEEGLLAARGGAEVRDEAREAVLGGGSGVREADESTSRGQTASRGGGRGRKRESETHLIVCVSVRSVWAVLARSVRGERERKRARTGGEASGVGTGSRWSPSLPRATRARLARLVSLALSGAQLQGPSSTFTEMQSTFCRPSLCRGILYNPARARGCIRNDPFSDRRPSSAT